MKLENVHEKICATTYYTDKIDLKRKCQSLTKSESLNGALLKQGTWQQTVFLKEDESM